MFGGDSAVEPVEGNMSLLFSISTGQGVGASRSSSSLMLPSGEMTISLVLLCRRTISSPRYWLDSPWKIRILAAILCLFFARSSSCAGVGDFPRRRTCCWRSILGTEGYHEPRVLYYLNAKQHILGLFNLKPRNQPGGHSISSRGSRTFDVLVYQFSFYFLKCCTLLDIRLHVVHDLDVILTFLLTSGNCMEPFLTIGQGSISRYFGKILATFGWVFDGSLVLHNDTWNYLVFHMSNIYKWKQSYYWPILTIFLKFESPIWSSRTSAQWASVAVLVLRDTRLRTAHKVSSISPSTIAAPGT